MRDRFLHHASLLAQFLEASDPARADALYALIFAKLNPIPASRL